jgi:fibronectin-binding autotransporter adhesin
VEGATITSGSTFLVEGFVSGGSAVLTLSGGDTIGKGAIVEAESGGIVSVTGTVTNSGGTFLALTGGTVDFTSNSHVNGNGVAVVQNGIVEIDGGGTETVDFTATGSGGLDLTSGNLYQGIVSGFGGPSHQNTAQFIDFRDVPFVSGTTSAVYVADPTHPTQSGTLEIVAGTTVEASVELAGNYTNAVFSVTTDGSGGVKVTDPQVTSGGTTTVTGNSPTGGTVVVNSVNATLFGNYMASMFATSAFNGGTLSSDLQTALEPQLAPPHH